MTEQNTVVLRISDSNAPSQRITHFMSPFKFYDWDGVATSIPAHAAGVAVDCNCGWRGPMYARLEGATQSWLDHLKEIVAE